MILTDRKTQTVRVQKVTYFIKGEGNFLEALVVAADPKEAEKELKKAVNNKSAVMFACNPYDYKVSTTLAEFMKICTLDDIIDVEKGVSVKGADVNKIELVKTTETETDTSTESVNAESNNA